MKHYFLFCCFIFFLGVSVTSAQYNNSNNSNNSNNNNQIGYTWWCVDGRYQNSEPNAFGDGRPSGNNVCGPIFRTYGMGWSSYEKYRGQPCSCSNNSNN